LLWLRFVIIRFHQNLFAINEQIFWYVLSKVVFTQATKHYMLSLLPAVAIWKDGKISIEIASFSEIAIFKSHVWTNLKSWTKCHNENKIFNCFKIQQSVSLFITTFHSLLIYFANNNTTTILIKTSLITNLLITLIIVTLHI